MTTRMAPGSAAIALLLATGVANASDPEDGTFSFDAGESIPGTLELNSSDTGRNARMTPVYSKYRLKVVFGGREVICMFHFAPGVRVIAPGESGDVNLVCREAVPVARAAARAIVREGGKDVGYVDIRLPAGKADRTP